MRENPAPLYTARLSRCYEQSKHSFARAKVAFAAGLSVTLVPVAPSMVLDVKPLVVYIVYFGPLPPWLPLTLQSMHVNPQVDFVVITNAEAPAVLPRNVHFERTSFTAMQRRLSELITPGNISSVRYDDTFAGHYNKGNDIKPLAAELYPQHTAGHEWWAWSDLDVVFGDLLKWLNLAMGSQHAACCRCIPREGDGGRGAQKVRAECAAATAAGHAGGGGVGAGGGGGGGGGVGVTGAGASTTCCKIPLARSRQTGQLEPRNINMVNVYSHKRYCPCEHGERVNVISPLYPNPWRKKAWGPFTAFRVGWGTSLFRSSPQWRGVIGSGDYAHFDEWWGEYHYSRGWETMGDVITRLAEVEGGAVLSKLKLPFAEAKTCTDYASGCSFCPCGAMRLRLNGATLTVNEHEVMLLHLAQSKFAWQHARGLSIPAWAPPDGGGAQHDGARMWARGCYEVRHLGRMNATCKLCSARAPTFTEWDVPGAIERATRLRRHRVQSDFRGHIVYETERPQEVRLEAGPCVGSA